MFKYYLPDSEGNPEKHESKTSSVIIIGANGSGKSRLGVWIENESPSPSVIHRIGAQRSLQFDNTITSSSYKDTNNMLIYGRYEPDLKCKKTSRYDVDDFNFNPIITLYKDYGTVLSLLISKKNLQNDSYVSQCKESQEYIPTPETVIDKFIRIWNNIFPHRDISFDDSKVNASFQSIIKNDEIKYNGREMSDGEKSALYLVAQCLAIDKDTTIIIDEPGLHLHKSITNKLWSAVERERPDCLFIYITHDTRFAANHSLSEKIWVKSYDGSNWEFEKIKGSELPEELLLDILGNRKNVLFVEGETGSLDHRLYSAIYKDCYVIPCGSCRNVIQYTKTFKKNNQLVQDINCYGIIDRDYRSEYELNKYKNDGVYSLNVAEIENLFIVEELMKYVSKIQGYDTHKEIEKAKKYIEDGFHNQINSQISKAVVSEIKYKLSTLEIPENEKKLEEKLNKIRQVIDYENIKDEIEKEFTDIKNEESYNEVLRVFNCKSLIKSIGVHFGLDKEKYHNFIIRKIDSKDRQEIINVLKPYLPKEIPIEQSI